MPTVVLTRQGTDGHTDGWTKRRLCFPPMGSIIRHSIQHKKVKLI